jgi:hypothetical protein
MSRDVTLFSLVHIYDRFGGTYCLSSRAISMLVTTVITLLMSKPFHKQFQLFKFGETGLREFR